MADALFVKNRPWFRGGFYFFSTWKLSQPARRWQYAPLL
ncbi:hypothetical protein ApDm4_0311 [Acetobacter pomorum]|nr:hypothetical protein ApDm4_0311 [Acetobacter pomorum]